MFVVKEASKEESSCMFFYKKTFDLWIKFEIILMSLKMSNTNINENRRKIEDYWKYKIFIYVLYCTFR